MLAPGLHARRRNRPQRRVQVDLRPVVPRTSPDRAAVKTANSSACAPTPPCDRRRLMNAADLFDFDSRMVPHRRHLGGIRQCGIEISLPARWIQPLAIATHCRVVEHKLDARAHSRGRLGLGSPDRLEDANDVRRPDVSNQELADDRFGIGSQGRRPLRVVLCVLPRLLVLRDVLRSDLSECLLRLALSRRSAVRGPTRRDRIDSLLYERPVLPGLVPSLSQRHGRKTSQTHLALPCRPRSTRSRPDA